MATTTAIRARFQETVSGAVADDDLAPAALLIAAEAYPELDVAAYLHRFDELAKGATRRISGAQGDDKVTALIAYLGSEVGFTGNRDDYYDLRNSYLNEVLDRRIGIPITLALVYVEVGRRVGLRIDGVGFPGHFLAVHRGDRRTIIDPFFATALDESDCVERLKSVMGEEAQFDERMLDSATPSEIVVRMLSNLKLIHLRVKNFEGALSCSERILLVEPQLATELRDRAALYLQLECFDAARADLERFLELAPDHESAELVRSELVKLSSTAPVLH